MTSRNIYIFLGLVAAVLCTPLKGAHAQFSSTNKARILYVGDSIAVETRNLVRFWTQATGKATMTASVQGGMAICDFHTGTESLVDASGKLRARVAQDRPNLVVLQFWGNGALFSDCMSGVEFNSEAYFTKYFWDAAIAVNQIVAGAQDAGVTRPKILWVLQGPDKTNRDRTRRLNEIYAFWASHFGDRVSDAGWSVSMAAYPYDNAVKDRYAWTQYLPCNDVERGTMYCSHPQAFGGVTQLHKDDDAIHFCLGNPDSNTGACDATSPGIRRYGTRIAHDANDYLGL